MNINYNGNVLEKEEMEKENETNNGYMKYDFNNNNHEVLVQPMQNMSTSHLPKQAPLKTSKPIARKFLVPEQPFKKDFQAFWESHPQVMQAPPSNFQQPYNNLVTNFNPVCSLKQTSNSSLNDFNADQCDAYSQKLIDNQFMPQAHLLSQPEVRLQEQQDKQIKELQFIQNNSRNKHPKGISSEWSSYVLQQQYLQQLKKQQQQQQDQMIKQYFQQQQNQNAFTTYTNIGQTPQLNDDDGDDDEEEFLPLSTQPLPTQQLSHFYPQPILKKQKPTTVNRESVSFQQPLASQENVIQTPLPSHITPPFHLSKPIIRFKPKITNAALVPKKNGKPVNQLSTNQNSEFAAVVTQQPKMAQNTPCRPYVPSHTPTDRNDHTFLNLAPKLGFMSKGSLPNKKVSSKCNKENKKPPSFQMYQNSLFENESTNQHNQTSSKAENMLIPLLRSKEFKQPLPSEGAVSKNNPDSTTKTLLPYSFLSQNIANKLSYSNASTFINNTTTNNNPAPCNTNQAPLISTKTLIYNSENPIPTNNTNKTATTNNPATTNNTNNTATTNNTNNTATTNHTAITNKTNNTISTFNKAFDPFNPDNSKQAILGSRPKRSILKNSGVGAECDSRNYQLHQASSNNNSTNKQLCVRACRLPEQQSEEQKRRSLQQWQQQQQHFTYVNSPEKLSEVSSREHEVLEENEEGNMRRKRVSFRL